VKRARMCVYLDVELSNWIKKNAMERYRSFSSFLNAIMLDYKQTVESTQSVKTLKSETKN